RLAAALAISSAILVLELLAGFVADSLALVGDAVHVLADVSGLAIALAAVWIANRTQASGGRSFGLYRLEILAASANALLLLAISVVVIVEGVRRLIEPPATNA